MRLKFDILFEFPRAGKIVFFQMVPQPKVWEIEFPPEESDSTKDLVTRLASGSFSAEAVSGLSASGTDLLTFLEAHALLSKVDLSDKENPFLRQVEVFDSWGRGTECPYAIQAKLEAAEVFVIGAGGVGSHLVNTLLSCGIGTIHVADYDTIETSNLARQCWYGRKDVGKKKVDVLAERMNQRGLGKVVPHDLRVGEDNIGTLLSDLPRVSLFTGLALPSNYMESDNFAVVEAVLKSGRHFYCLGEHDAGPLLGQQAGDLAEHVQLSLGLRWQKSWEDARAVRAPLGQHPSFPPVLQRAVAHAADEIVRSLSGFAAPRTIHSRFSVRPISGESVLMNMRSAGARHG